MKDLFLLFICVISFVFVACSSVQGTKNLERDLDLILEQQEKNMQATR
jgi:uncharacterized protein YcfL